MVHDDRDDKLGNTENESEGSANARLILHNGNVEGRTGCQDQSDREEEQPMAEMGCMMYETPVSDAKFMMTVATALASTDADNIKAGGWPRSGWHMVDAVEPKQRDVNEPNAVEIDEQMPEMTDSRIRA
jgi:hypothetical protein